MECALGHAMKAQNQRFGFKLERIELRAKVLSQRPDIGGIVIVGRQRAQRGLPAHRPKCVGRAVYDGGGRGSAILRIKRSNQNTVASGPHQRLQLGGDGRVAIAHCIPHADRFPQTGLELLGLVCRNDRERRASVSPDLRIRVRRAFRSSPQHDTAQDRLPGDSRDLHHAPVRKELAKIALHCARARLVGRAEVDQQYAYPTRLDGIVISWLAHNPPDSSGNRLRRRPVAENNALAIAGATGATASSPGSNGSAVLSIRSTLISGLPASVGNSSPARRLWSGSPRSYSRPEPSARPTP